MDVNLRKTLAHVAEFYDQRKVGERGALGFRRSSDLKTLADCAGILLRHGIIIPGKTLFLDLGCADGRVNVILSYLVRLSAGIELDDWTLDEYGQLRALLEDELDGLGLPVPPENIRLFNGDSSGEEIYEAIKNETGAGFEDFDLFYTYLVMHEEFAELIRAKGKAGAIFMVYGVDRIIPRYGGLRLLALSPLAGSIAVYRKE
ncbi:MAG: hypothetical protein C4582_00605 [Desulfobacteraceae bacterium]|jgi:hypothetical protein|nr:MAG: hypothetical protein C4582_00605 [Desulfobacteraceae bacterium]